MSSLDSKMVLEERWGYYWNEVIKMLSAHIRQLRSLRGMTQTDLARILGVSKQSVSNWENDNIQPSVEMLVKICRCFSVSADYMLDLSQRQYLETTGLTVEQLSHLQQVVDDLRLCQLSDQAE